MRGRRRTSADKSASQDLARMPLRKQVLKDAGDVPSGSHQIDDDTEEDEALEDDNDEFSSSLLSPSASRGTRRREKENKSKPKEMTEEEMMDLALRLSEQEASITALRLQKEEEAMMKAIHESMTQPCPASQSQSLLSDPEASLRIGSRRKLLYSNGQPASGDGCTVETDQNRAAKQSGDGSCNWNKKRKRKEGSPLLEMPDLSQSQKINSQASTCSSEVLELHLDSQQSTDSTQIDDCHRGKSPVFPLTGFRAEVHVPRLTQDLLQNCRTSGFVLCSSDSSASPPKSSSAQPKSPTFPKSPERSDNLMTVPKSPVFSETDQDDGAETQPSPEYFKSPVFGSNTQNKKSSSASKPQVSVCNSGFMFSSQESLTSSVRSTSCRPTSPVFPRSPNVPPERPAASRSPVFSETDGGQAEHSRSHCSSPVFGRSGRRQKIHLDEQKHSANPSAAELTGSICGGNSATAGGLRQDGETDGNRRVGLNESCKSDDVEEDLTEISKDRESAVMELTSDMTLLLSDEDDVTPVGSPSPVFPEERPVLHVTAASPGTSGSTCSPSTATGRQQRSTAEREQRPISSQGAVSSVSAPPGQPAGGSTVHYYWGVPFCPRGLDPDSYTKVILAQMQVYENSLKQAQRRLLRKAEWGEAVLPQPEKSPSPEPRAESPQELFPRRRGFRLKSKKLCDAAETPPAEAEEATEEEEGNNKGDKDKQEIENKEEEKKNEAGGGQVDSDDCEVCPETQLSDNDDDRTQDLMIATDAGAELRQKSPEPPEVEMILQDDSPAVQELQDEEMEVEVEVDAPADRKTKGNMPVRSGDVGGNVRKEVVEQVEEDGEDPDVEEIKDRRLQRSSSPELEPAVVPRSPETSVDCPICQGSFPVTEIEMHAAYCDGDVDERRREADCFQVTSKPRRKRTRRADPTAEETNEPPNAVRNPEKCFICQKAVPLRDFSRHTELCIQQQRSKTAAKGNLLSALEKTDSRDAEAGPSGSKPQPSDVIDLRDDDDDEEEEGGVSAFRVSNSPIRAFTPISEAAGCLIDFKKQHRTKKLSQRRR